MTRPRVKLDDHWMERSRVFGFGLVDFLKHRPDYPKLINGIDRKPEVIAHSKAGEVAFALMTGADPERLKWTPDWGGELGHDVMLNCRRVDVKTVSKLYSRCFLIWPVNKWGDFERAQFDVLALVAGEGNVFEWHGWVSKDRFRAEHLVEGTDGYRKLAAGTPFMNGIDLNPPVVWPDMP